MRKRDCAIYNFILFYFFRFELTANSFEYSSFSIDNSLFKFLRLFIALTVSLEFDRNNPNINYF